MPGRDRSYDPAAVSHRALRGIRQALERHPAIETARGFPETSHSHVVAQLDASPFGLDVEDATLTVRWFAGESSDSRPQFSFHYSDATSGDFGWHHEPNPHVEGWGHFQERTNPEMTYSYEPHTFSSLNPARVVWEVMSLLASRLQSL